MTCLENHRAVERLLEDESLTAELVDEAAEVLLDWGASRAEALAQEARAELDVRLAFLRCMLRCVNRCAGDAPPEEQAKRVRGLLAEIAPQKAPEAHHGT